MKLFLASQGLPEKYRADFTALLPNRNTPAKLAWVTDASEPYAKKEPLDWLENSRQELLAAGFELVPVRLQDFVGKTAELKAVLEPLDAVWISGGNTHFICYAMAISGFDSIITELLENGLVYAGESAGAMVAGPNIEGSENAADLADVPKLIQEGLNLFDALIIPHYNRPEFQEFFAPVIAMQNGRGCKTLPLKDGEAIIIR